MFRKLLTIVCFVCLPAAAFGGMAPSTWQGKSLVVRGDDALLAAELNRLADARDDWDHRVRVDRVECLMIDGANSLGCEKVHQYIVYFVDDGAVDPQRRTWQTGMLVFVETPDCYIELRPGEPRLEDPRAKVVSDFKKLSLRFVWPWKGDRFRK